MLLCYGARRGPLLSIYTRRALAVFAPSSISDPLSWLLAPSVPSDALARSPLYSFHRNFALLHQRSVDHLAVSPRSCYTASQSTIHVKPVNYARRPLLPPRTLVHDRDAPTPSGIADPWNA